MLVMWGYLLMANVIRSLFLIVSALPGLTYAGVDVVSTLYGAHNRSVGAQSQQLQAEYQNSVEQSAKNFGVTAQEWTRYRSIMDGEGRFHWKDTDPRVVLGIYSKNATQRKKYAEIMARREYELNKNFIEFNQEYVEAFQRLYGNEPIMDITKVAAFQNQYSTTNYGSTKPKGLLSAGDRIVLFVSTDCTSCDSYFRQVRKVQEFSALDVYFVNDSREKITQWAKEMEISRDDVSSGNITLNSDTEMYAKYGRPALPASFYFNNSDKSVSAFLPE